VLLEDKRRERDILKRSFLRIFKRTIENNNLFSVKLVDVVFLAKHLRVGGSKNIVRGSS
jgi:hypothetical protein